MTTEQAPASQTSEGMWDALAPTWDARGDWHARTTRDLTAAMVDALSPQPGDTVVELACGPTADGSLEVAVRLPGECRVIASDLSGGMLTAARRRAESCGAAVEFAKLDVTALDLADAGVDRLLSRWVYMLLPDPGAALAEARRVLRPGGRLVFAVFASPQANPFFMLPAGVLIEQGLLKPPTAGEPSMFALADAEATAALARKAGFDVVRSDDVALAYRLADGDDLWSYCSDFTGPVALTIRKLDAATQAEVRAEIERRAERFLDGAGYALPGSVLVFSCE